MPIIKNHLTKQYDENQSKNQRQNPNTSSSRVLGYVSNIVRLPCYGHYQKGPNFAMNNPIPKKAENFLTLWHCEITVTDNREGLSLDAGCGILIGICEDQILLRCGNIITKWISLNKAGLKFFVTKF